MVKPAVQHLQAPSSTDYLEKLRTKRTAGRRLTQREESTLALHDNLFAHSEPQAPNNARGLGPGSEDESGSIVKLALDEVKPYEHNPRRDENEEFEAIKEWLRQTRRTLVLPVTRRPGEQIYTLAEGAATRYRALRELYDERLDECYRWILGVYSPWKGESHVLIAHLGENIQRCALTFWDLACGLERSKVELEADLGGQPLTLRTLELQLASHGLKVNLATLSAALFAAQRLGVLGQAASALSLNDVRILQPGINSLLGLAKRIGWDEERAWTAAILPALDDFRIRYEQALAEGDPSKAKPPVAPDALVTACRAAFATEAGQTSGAVEKMLRILADNPTLPGPDLLLAVRPPASSTAGNSDAGQRAAAPPSGGESPAAGASSGICTSQDASLFQDDPNPSPAAVGQVAAESAAAGRASRGSIVVAPPPDCRTGPHSPGVQTPPAPTAVRAANGSASDVAPDVAQLAADLAQSAGLSVVPADAMPLGYWIDFTAIPPSEADARWVWWLLASSSGQLLPQWCEPIPADSSWARLLSFSNSDEFDDEDLIEAVRENVGFEAPACELWTKLLAGPHGPGSLSFLAAAARAWAQRGGSGTLLPQVAFPAGRAQREA